MNEALYSITQLFDSVRAHVPLVLALLGALFLIHLVNTLLGGRLNIFGILPRHPWGLLGVVASPLLHADFNHLFFNAIPLFILSILVLLEGVPVFIKVTISVSVISGFLTWCFGRKGLHIGASGLIMGYWSYLLTNAYSQQTVVSVILGIVCVYYFGGFLFQIFPGKKTTSWEGHLFGVIAGVIVALFVRPMFSIM